MNEIENLPNTWAKAQVRELIDLVNGFAFKPSHWQSHGLPIIRIQNLNNPEAAFNYCPEDLPRKYLVDSGELLFAWSGTPGTSFGAHIWQGGKAWLNQHIFKIQLNEGYLNKKFLRLAINQNLNQYIRAAHGAAGLAHITKGKFESSELMIPPLREQKRIIDEIEKQFTRLDAAVAALRRIQANLKRYRASVLKAACEGRLVPTEAELVRREGRDYEPADRLLARILKERRAKWEADQLAKMQAAGKPPKDDKWKAKYHEPSAPDTSTLPELPEGWVWSTVEHLAEIQLGKMLDQKKHRSGQQLPYLRNINVRWGSIDTGDLLSMFFENDELDRFGLKSGDVLVCEGGEPGRAAVWDGRMGEMKYQKALHRVRFHNGYKPKILIFFLERMAKSGHLERWFTGSTIKHFTRESFTLLPVPVSPFAEQCRTVAEVERRLSVVDELESDVAVGLKRAERLRQAILKRAFEGKLVPQDPNDEPASALLERIRAERASANHAAVVNRQGGKTRSIRRGKA